MSEISNHFVAAGHTRRVRALLLAGIVLALLLGTLAAGVILAREQSRSQLLSTFHQRGMTSATFVSTYLVQQAQREQHTGAQFLSVARVPSQRFELATAAFGSTEAMLLDRSGRLLDTVPVDPAIVGRPATTGHNYLDTAEHGAVAISNLVPSAAKREPVTAIAVPFQTRFGLRVFSVAYRVSGSAVGAFVDHTVPYREHEVFLIDGAGGLLAASPRTAALTLAEVDPALARAVAHSSTSGTVNGAQTPSTFTIAPVRGTSWRMVIAVPDSRLYLSIAGWTNIVPWVIFALVAVLAAALVMLSARSLADRARLASLSQVLAKSARTDSLTGLYNRRALDEHLARMTAHARRRQEPISVLMIDLDRFKETNDSHGHAAGDEVLCAFAQCMGEILRGGDLCGRFGGDEFLILLPATDEQEARGVVERLQEAARAIELSDIGLPRGVELSVGCATAVHTTPEEVVNAADAALYRAKTGRTATVAASE